MLIIVILMVLISISILTFITLNGFKFTENKLGDFFIKSIIFVIMLILCCYTT